MSQDLICFGLVALSHKSLISPEVPVSAADAPVQVPAHTYPSRKLVQAGVQR